VSSNRPRNTAENRQWGSDKHSGLQLDASALQRRGFVSIFHARRGAGPPVSRGLGYVHIRGRNALELALATAGGVLPDITRAGMGPVARARERGIRIAVGPPVTRRKGCQR